MSQKQGISGFIDELRRRRVFRVAAFYGGIAFVVVQIIDGTFEVMGIPAWVSRLMIILLGLGFPLAMGLAWIFDITPDGIVRTEGRFSGKPGTSNRALITMAIAAVAFGIWGRWGGDGIGSAASYEHSIAVMPFDNLTGDNSIDVWEKGVARLMTNTLTGSKDLYVLDSDAVFDIIGAVEQVQAAQIIPPVAREVARRANVEQVVMGEILQAGSRFRLALRIVAANTGEVTFAAQIDGDDEDAFFSMTDQQAKQVKNYLEIEIFEEGLTYDFKYTISSAKAYLFFMEAIDARLRRDPLDEQVGWLEKSVEADTLALPPRIWLISFYHMAGEAENLARIKEYLALKEADMSFRELREYLAVLAYVEKDYTTMANELRRLLDRDPDIRVQWFQLGLTQGYLGRWKQAAESYSECVRLGDQWGSPLKWRSLYSGLGGALHRLGRHKEELRAYQKALVIWPGEPAFLRSVAAAYLDLSKASEAEKTLDEMAAAAAEDDWSEARLLHSYGRAYAQAERFEAAEEYFLQAIEADSTFDASYNSLAYMLIDQEIDPERGVKLARQAMELQPETSYIMDTHGWGLYKLGRYSEALEILEQSWALSIESTFADREHLEAARKAVAEQ